MDPSVPACVEWGRDLHLKTQHKQKAVVSTVSAVAVTALLVLLQDAAQSKVYCLIRTAEQIQRAVVKQQGRKPRRKFIGSNKIWLRQVLRCKMTCTCPIPNLTSLYGVVQLQRMLGRNFGRLLITIALCSKAFVRCRD